MNTEQLQQKKAFIKDNIHALPRAVYENYMSAFEIEYTHNSTAIEGNTLSLMEPSSCSKIRYPSAGKSCAKYTRS